MKKVLQRIFFAGILLLSYGYLQAQTSTADPFKIYKDWTFLLETNNEFEFSARVVKCTQTGTDQVHVMVFNEDPDSRSLTWEVKIVNLDDNKSTSKKITYSFTPGEMVIPDCSASFTSMKIDVPSYFNPDNLEISITVL